MFFHFAFCDTETVFYMINGLFYIYSCFVDGFPFIRSFGGSGIDVYHPSAGRYGTWIFAFTFTVITLCFFVMYPVHFGAYKLHGGKTAAEMGFATFSRFIGRDGSFGQHGMPFSLTV